MGRNVIWGEMLWGEMSWGEMLQGELSFGVKCYRAAILTILEFEDFDFCNFMQLFLAEISQKSIFNAEMTFFRLSIYRN